MTELEELAAVRSDVPPMSNEARAAGRARLTAAMSQRRPRRLVPALAAGVALAAAVTGVAVVGSPDRQHPAQAAEVLNRAAAAVESNPDPVPRPDQYIFLEGRTLTSKDGPIYHGWSWLSADGSKPGWRRTVDESEACRRLPAGCTVDDGPITNDRQGFSLTRAPYTELAKLPTDPAKLLAALRADVGSHPASPDAGLSQEVQIWSVMRSVLFMLPNPQRAALYRAAASLRGITAYPNIADAAGRVGIGVGLDDPRIGRVILIFDPKTYRYLGEVILDPRDHKTAAFKTALLRTAVVDRVRQMPR